jgi:hypothetical protein
MTLNHTIYEVRCNINPTISKIRVVRPRCSYENVHTHQTCKKQWVSTFFDDFRHLVKQGCRYPRAENPIGLPQTKLSRPVVTIPSRILERVDATAEALGQ